MKPTNPEFNHLAELAAQLPKELRSDWKGTNHYELTTGDSTQSYWWWQLDEISDPRDADTQESVAGQRLGLLMDIAAEVSRLRDLGLLPKE